VTASAPELPLWLTECLVSDGELAQAYESIAPQVLASCKHTLSVQHAFFGEAPDFEEHSLARLAHGFQARIRSRPADWALVLFDAQYASAPRLLAAVMPALLARVPLVLCASTPGPARPDLLCALEFAGLEHLYALSAAQSMELLHSLVSQPGQGRLALLHQGDLAALRAAADAAEVPCWEERRAPVLRICGPEPDAALIALAHPDAVCADTPAPDALYCSGTPEAQRTQAPLTLPPGMEGCWLHPSLTPDFFRARSLIFGPAPGKPTDGAVP